MIFNDSESNFITVDGEQSTGISITMPPDKLEYIEGESFDKTGMMVMLFTSTGSKQPVFRYGITPSGPLKSSDTFVEISYSEYKARQRVFVRSAEAYGNSGDNAQDEMTFTGIRVAKLPNKVTYREGDMLDITGIRVVGRLTGTDSSEVNITSFTVGQVGPLTYGTKK